MLKKLTSPWVDTFDYLVRQAESSLVVCSPFIGRGPCARIISLLQSCHRQDLSLHVLTDLSRENMLSGITDVGALIQLCEALPRTDVRFFPNVHAKVYIADQKNAIVTSGNLTANGLSRNFEYGIFLDDHDLVEAIRADVMDYRSVASAIELPQLKVFEKIIADLSDIQIRAAKRLKSQLRREFDTRLRQVDEAILRARVDGLTAHATFADTVLFLLKKGPRDTTRIYTEVQAIHPDLCDESIKLVIRGETWSQAKWRHKVRHAQQFLARQGRIGRKNGRWHLIH